MCQRHRSPLPRRQTLERQIDPPGEILPHKLLLRCRIFALRFGNGIDVIGGMTAQTVKAEICRNAMQPCAELRPARLPARGMSPDPEKYFLSDFLGVGMTAEHAAGESEHAGKMPVDEQPASRLVTQRDTRHQFVV